MLRLTLQETMDRIALLVRAGYPVIYVVSHEEARVLDYLARLHRVLMAESPGKRFLRWTAAAAGLEEFTGLTAFELDPAAPRPWLTLPGLAPGTARWQREDPVDALDAIRDANDGVLRDSVTVFFDVHHGLRADAAAGAGGALVRPLRNAAERLRRYFDENRRSEDKAYKTIIVVAPSAAGLSNELERDIVVLDFPLPDTAELRGALDAAIDRGVLEFPEKISPDDVVALCGAGTSDEDYKVRLLELIAGAGRGLTLDDYRLGLNMFALGPHGLRPEHVEDMLNRKASAIDSQALRYTPRVQIELGGMEPIKTWVSVRRDAAISPELRARFHLPPPKGVMLCGASGGGKSQLAKLIAKEFNLALLRLDVGALFGMYVGESEERTRQALQLAEMLAPVVLWVDEVDKAFAGMGNAGDSGVSARVFGHFLTWLAEKQDSVFVVATANDFRVILATFPEFGRKGRFDQIFWVGLPDPHARKEIFSIYLRELAEGSFLAVTHEEVDRLARKVKKPVPATGEDLPPFDRLCTLLAVAAEHMTGAEIEYAVTDALYGAYQEARLLDQAGLLSAELVVMTVASAAGQALYRFGSPERNTLDTDEQYARDKRWIFVN